MKVRLTPVAKFLLSLLIVSPMIWAVNHFARKNSTYTRKATASILPMVSNGDTKTWKIVTAWSKECVIMQEEIRNLAKDLSERSKGAINIEFVETPKGKLKDLFKMVANNEVQILHGTSYYWKDVMPATVFFASVPFGMNHDEAETWLKAEGLTLWQELYAPHNVIPFPCGHSGAQMGGWFNREINTMKDFDGLWMRIAGLGGLVLEKHGVRIKECPAGEIYNFLDEDKKNRAAEFIGAFDDYNLGLHQIGTYYYNGWQEPNTTFELIVNKSAFDGLRPETQEILQLTIETYNERIYRRYNESNAAYKKKLIAKGIQFRTFSPDIKQQLNRTTLKILEDYINADTTGNSKMVYESYLKYKHI
jgi:TRAP-type mannitol/chloroaromatic compound transport system substrate-binding protein